MPEWASPRPESSARRTCRLPWTWRRWAHQLALPNLRRRGVRAAVEHALHGAGRACGRADLDPPARRPIELTFQDTFTVAPPESSPPENTGWWSSTLSSAVPGGTSNGTLTVVMNPGSRCGLASLFIDLAALVSAAYFLPAASNSS